MGQLKDNAEIIRDETQAGANTAQRVGGWMVDAAEEIESKPGYINIFDFDSGSSQSLDNDAWDVVKGSFQVGFQRNGLALATNEGEIKYTGATPKIFQVEFIVAMTGASGRKLHVALFKNEQLWPCSEFAETIPPGGGEVSIPAHCLVSLSASDVVQVYVKCSNNSANITIDNCNVIIKEL
jgi:hypothetical protein